MILEPPWLDFHAILVYFEKISSMFVLHDMPPIIYSAHNTKLPEMPRKANLISVIFECSSPASCRLSGRIREAPGFYVEASICRRWSRKSYGAVLSASNF